MSDTTTETITIQRADLLLLLSSMIACRNSCNEAIDGTWDKSNDGFEDMAFALSLGMQPFKSLIAESGLEDEDDNELGEDGCENNDCEDPDCHRCFPVKGCTLHEKCIEQGE